MVDCGCTNFPAGLGNVTIGASLGIGTMTPGARLDVMSGAVATPVAIKAGRTSEEATLGVSAGSGQWSARADGPGDVVLRSMNGDLILSGQTDAAKILFTTGAADTTKMTIENNGNVSIGASLAVGTASPGGKLDVRGGGADTQTFFLSGAADKMLAMHVGRTAADGTLAVPGVGGQWSAFAAAGDVVLRSYPGNLILSAQNGGKIVLSTGVTEAPRITITNTGQVGIGGGTAAPTSPLSLTNASTGFANRIAVYEASGADFRGIGMANPPGAFGVAVWANVAPSDTNMRMFVRDDGNVGINTSAPTDRLHVDGTIRADGAIRTTNQQDITANGDLRAERDLIVINNATINQDLTAHSSIRAGDPWRKIADGSGCYYA